MPAPLLEPSSATPEREEDIAAEAAAPDKAMPIVNYAVWNELLSSVTQREDEIRYGRTDTSDITEFIAELRTKYRSLGDYRALLSKKNLSSFLLDLKQSLGDALYAGCVSALRLLIGVAKNLKRRFSRV